MIFPAFALPITIMRKCLYLARSFAASSGVNVTVGVGSAGAVGSVGVLITRGVAWKWSIRQRVEAKKS